MKYIKKFNENIENSKLSFVDRFKKLDKEYPTKTQEYWTKWRAINDEWNERLSKIDPSIFPKNLFKSESHLEFSYKGTEFPNQEMKDWIDREYSETETMDDLEKDMEYSRLQNDFFDCFGDKLGDLSYMQMLDVFTKVVDYYLS